MANSPTIVSLDLNTDILSNLSTRIGLHGLIRAARCLLCGALHQQVYVGILLCEGNQPLGDLCPRCLSEPPDRCARQVWERAAHLWVEVGAGLTHEGFPWLPEETAAKRSRRAEDRRRREHERRRRLAGPAAARPEPEPVTQAEKEHLADLLLRLAEEVGWLHEWPTAVAAVRQAEEEAIQAHHAELPAEVVGRFVQARYGEFIPGL